MDMGMQRKNRHEAGTTTWTTHERGLLLDRRGQRTTMFSEALSEDFAEASES
jgi:hypothetical protein